MKAVLRRLRRIETQLKLRPNVVAHRAVELLRERRRRRAEASGQPFQEPLPLAATTPGRRLSVAETLRARRLGGERAAVAVGPK